MERTIIFGDVHGCYREWQDLLEKLAVTASDSLVSVGDLICKGPSTAQTLEVALSLPNLKCVVGNHERRFLDCWKTGRRPDIKPYDSETVRDMGDRYQSYMTYIASWPHYLNLKDLLVVHAGLRPGVPLSRQDEKDLTNLRTVEPDGLPWYILYESPRPVVFGHWVRREPLVLPQAIGLDTGCVYGGKLSAYVLPDRKILSVPARQAYAHKNSWS